MSAASRPRSRDFAVDAARHDACSSAGTTTLHPLLLRLRWLALVLPLFAIVSSVQVGCTNGSGADDYSSEDQASTRGYGYGYGHR